MCVLQNTATGYGVQANPKPSDISYIRDRYFETVYQMVNSSLTANSAPASTLRGKALPFCLDASLKPC